MNEMTVTNNIGARVKPCVSSTHKNQYKPLDVFMNGL